MTPPQRCYYCALEPPAADEAERERLGQPIKRMLERDRREHEGLTIVDGTLTCLHHVRSAQRSAQMAEDARVQQNRRERGGPGYRPI